MPIIAGFTGGSGSSSPDQFPGTSGDGWAGAWDSFQGPASSVTRTVANTIPVDGGGNYLFIEHTYSGGSGPVGRTSRQYQNFDDVDVAEDHALRFSIRYDALPATWSNLGAFGRRTAPSGGTGGDDTWEILSQNGGNWFVRDGAGTTDTGVGVAEDVVYTFVLSFDLTSDTYGLTILVDGVEEFVGSGFEYRNTSASGPGAYVSWFSQLASASDVMDYSLDSIEVAESFEEEVPEVVLWEANLETEPDDGVVEGEAHITGVGTVAITGVQEGVANGEAHIVGLATVAIAGEGGETGDVFSVVLWETFLQTEVVAQTGEAHIVGVASVSITGAQAGVVEAEVHVVAEGVVSTAGTATKIGSVAISAVGSVSIAGGAQFDVDFPEPVVIGTTTVTGQTATINVNATVPAGVVVFVDVVHRNPESQPTISDSSDNTYITELSETRPDTRALRFRASDSRRLTAGSTITLDGFEATPDGTGAAVAYYVSAVLGPVADTARNVFGSTSATSSGPVDVTDAPALLLGLLEVNGGLGSPAFPEFGQVAQRNNGSSAQDRSIVSAYQVAGAPGEYGWDITFSTSRAGSANLLAYPIVQLLGGTITIRAVSGPSVGRRPSGPRVARRVTGPGAK